MRISCLIVVATLAACGDSGTGGAGAAGAAGSGAAGSGAAGSGAAGAGAAGSGAAGSGAAGSGAAGSGAAGSGAAGSGAGGSGAGGSGGGDLSECDTNADCPQGTCIELIPGYRVCQVDVVEATACTKGTDECCNTGECDAGEICVETPIVPFCAGIIKQPHNVCGSDLCMNGAECKGGVCAPAGTFGNKVAACLFNECEGDCSCGLVRDPCCNGVTGFFCITDCQSSADCAPGSYCDTGTCTPGEPICPL